MAASEFLRRKAAEAAAETSRKYGDDAPGGTKWLQKELSKSAEEKEQDRQNYYKSEAEKQIALSRAIDLSLSENKTPETGAKPDRSAEAYERAKQEARQKKATEGYEQAQKAAAEDRAIMEADLAEYENWADEDKRALETYVNFRQNSITSGGYAVPARKAYENLVSKYGAEKVANIAESWQRDQNAKATQKLAEYSASAVDGKTGASILHSAATVPANLFGSVAGIYGAALDLATRTGRYSTLDPNNVGNMANVYSGAVRGQVAENISGDEYDETGDLISDGGKVRQLLSYGYQGVMSAADSLARLAIGGEVGSLALAAAGSFSQTVSEASKRGATPEQAIILGVGTAAIEAATEKIPLDNMLKAAKGGKKGAMAIATEALRQAGIEATTEEISLFAGLLWEAAVMQEKSAYKQSIGEGIANGMTYDEAKEQADKAIWAEALNTAAVSAVAGGLSGGGSATFGQVFGNGGEVAAETKPDAQSRAEPAAAQTANQEQQTQPQQGATEQVAQETPATQTPASQEVIKTPEQMVLDAATETGRQFAPESVPKSELQIRVDNATDAAWKQNAQERGLRYKASKVNTAILDLVDRVKKGLFKGSEKVQLGTVSDANAAQIQRETGIDTRGYDVAIEARQIDHILKDHGENGASNHSMANPEDIARIEYALNNPDRIVKAGQTRAYVTNKNGQMKPADTVLYETQLEDGSYYVVQAVPETKKRTLYVVTAFIGDSGYKNEVPQSTDVVNPSATPGAESTVAQERTTQSAGANNPSATPKAESVGTSNIIISDAKPEVKGTGAAEANFSGKAQYQELLYEGNVQPDRPGDVRPMEVPKTDSYGRNVSEFVADAYGAEVTPDKMASTIEELVQEGALGFDKRSNQDALNDAAKVIERSTPGAITKRITGNIANGKILDGDIEQAMLLYSHYANKNGERAQGMAAELMVDLTTMAHMTGRNLQLFKLLRKMTPEGQVYTIRRTVEQNVENMIRSGKAEDGQRPQINEQLLDDYRKAAEENARAVSPEQRKTSEDKMVEIQQAIMADAASQVQSTFKAKWDAWRYMAMLGNGKTQIRNFAGNVLFMPYKAVKDTAGAAFEKLLPKEQRTKSLTTDSELLNWARQDAKTGAVQDALKYTGHLGDDATNAKFKENVRVFDNQTLEAARKVVESLPQKGDLFFKNQHYAASLAGFLRARGYNLSDVQNGKVSDAVMAEARGYAINEAMKATFNDCNSFSDMVSNLRFKDPDTTWKKVANMAGESALPYRRTPANIVVRFAEYSPAGLLKGAWDMADKVASGKLSAAAAIDQIAAGVTGSGALLLGYFLAKGIGGVKITGGGTDEDEKRQGHQDYALEFSIDGKEYSYKIDWAAPANLPLFVGANLYQALEGKDADTSISAFSRIIQTGTHSLEPMLQLSCLSSLNELFESARYAPEGEALYSVAADIATGYFTQGIPALLRQTSQALQENKQTTFANDADPNVRELQKLGAQIPLIGGEFQTDKRNAWGETETTESGVWRAVNAFISPGTLKEINNSELEREITRLGKTQEQNVTPPEIPKKLNYTGTDGTQRKDYRLTEEQYQKLAQAQGQTAKNILESMVKSSEYKKLTDAQKAYAVRAVYEYAQEKGKQAALKDYHSNAAAWIAQTKKTDTQAFIARGAKIALDDAIGNAVADLNNNWKVDNTTQSNMEDSYKAFKGMTEKTQQQIIDEASAETVRYLTARSAGVSTQNYLNATKNVKKLGSNSKAAQKYKAVAGTSGLPESAKDALIKAYMPDYDPKADEPNTTELKYDYARKELGLTAQEFAEVYRVAAEDYKKDEMLAQWKAQGYSAAECSALWALFKASGTKKTDVIAWHNGQ